MVLSPKIAVRRSPVAGKGLFATAAINTGEWVWKEDPDEKEKYWKTTAQVDAMSPEDRAYFLNFAYVVAPGVLSGVTPGQTTDGGEYMNHSCKPTAVPFNNTVYIAARDIAPGDEITYDYCTTETPESSHTPFTCRCGDAACRGTITGLDCLDPVLMARYDGHFSSTVVAFQSSVAMTTRERPA
jgi:SET domain-containing protein